MGLDKLFKRTCNLHGPIAWPGDCPFCVISSLPKIMTDTPIQRYTPSEIYDGYEAGGWVTFHDFVKGSAHDARVSELEARIKELEAKICGECDEGTCCHCADELS